MPDKSGSRRFNILIVFLIGGTLLLGKAMHIQLLSDTYRVKTAGIDKVTVYPSRGLIYDRNEKLLVNNLPVYDLMVHYNRLDSEMDTAKFCKLLNITQNKFKKNVEKDWSDPRYSKVVPFVFLSKIPAVTFARFQEYLHQFPGFSPQVRYIRSYPYANAAHVLGYIREVNQREVKTSSGEYVPGDYIGAAGLELSYERVLKGEKGVSFVLKDKYGREVGSYQDGELDTLPAPGSDLITTLDINLQAYGEQLMQNKSGSIVAIEPATGEILAMISMPTYDPNRLTINKNRGAAFKELLEDPNLPFFDRAVMAKYPPGSIFKTVVALAGMQEEVINPNTGFACANGYYYNGRLYGCHTHPYAANVKMAIQHSCNTYFWQTFRRIIDKHSFYKPEEGLSNFNKYLYQFGLGRPLGIDFPREKSGNVPTPEYYDRIYKSRGGWKSPTIMSLGIGQGELQLTSLQMANLAAAIANRGYYYTPHLVQGIKDLVYELDSIYLIKHDIDISPAYFEPVIEGMEKVVLAGTATSAWIPNTTVCGKTGTAENPHGEDHSVFFGFAPKENPRIAIAVYVENAGWGSSFAAPIASLMMEQYLTGMISPQKKYLEERMLNADLINNP